MLYKIVENGAKGAVLEIFRAGLAAKSCQANCGKNSCTGMLDKRTIKGQFVLGESHWKYIISNIMYIPPNSQDFSR